MDAPCSTAPAAICAQLADKFARFSLKPPERSFVFIAVPKYDPQSLLRLRPCFGISARCCQAKQWKQCYEQLLCKQVLYGDFANTPIEVAQDESLRCQGRAKLAFDIVSFHSDKDGDILGLHAPGIDLSPHPAGNLANLSLSVFEIPNSRHLAVYLAMGSCKRQFNVRVDLRRDNQRRRFGALRFTSARTAPPARRAATGWRGRHGRGHARTG